MIKITNGLRAAFIGLALLTAGCSSSEPARQAAELAEQDKAAPEQSSEADSKAAPDEITDTKESEEIEQAASDYALAGSIDGKYPIEMKLTVEGTHVSGSYMYTKYKQSIKLQGTASRANMSSRKLSISMDELGKDSAVTGHFDGSLIVNAVGDTVFSGSWTSTDGKKNLPFKATISSTTTAPTSSASIPAADTAWLGDWDWIGTNQFSDQELTIAKIDARSIEFVIYSRSGGHTGEVTETAVRSKDGKSATFTGNGLTLKFSLHDSVITVVSEGDSSYYAGIGAFFGGDFIKGAVAKEFDLLQLGVLPSRELNDRFKELAGDGYDLFKNSFQMIDSFADEELLDTTVVTGGVRGLFTEMEAIIMYDENGTFYAAVIDGVDVKFYTTDKTSFNILPKAIEKWRSRFSEKALIYMSA